jgi:hypothetical protein
MPTHDMSETELPWNNQGWPTRFTVPSARTKYESLLAKGKVNGPTQ